MTFKKTGEIPIESIKCSCGMEIKGSISKCPHCAKELIPENLQVSIGCTCDEPPCATCAGTVEPIPVNLVDESTVK